MTTRLVALVFSLACIAFSPFSHAQGAGGLYIANGQFGFADAVRQALADNPTPGKFFVLSLPPATQGLLADGAPSGDADLRRQAIAAGAQFLVCRRDVRNGSVVPGNLVPGVGVVSGWQQGPDAPEPDANGLYPGERAGDFPVSVELVRRIRSACSD